MRTPCLIVSILCFHALAARAAPGLLAGYGFSEGSGTATADASGNGLGGTLVNAPAWVTGRNGTGLSFNGSSTYVDLGNPAALQLTGSMTLSAWVFETANVGDDGQIVAKSNGSSGFQLKSTPDTGVRTFGVAVTNASGVNVQRYSSTVRALNTWYHVAGVYDSVARTLNIYVNGALANGVLSGAVPASQRVGAVNANIGRRTGGYHIRGTVDDVRIYGRALTQAEIQADMSTPVGSAAPPADTSPPSAPSNVVATAVSSTEVNLSWSASTDNVGVTGYSVFRNGALVGSPATSSFANTGLSAATTYSYTVSARDAAANVSPLSAPATVTTPPNPSGSGTFQNEILVSGLNLPTAIKFLPDGRMLVLELGGTIRIVQTTTWQVDPTPFLTLTNIGTLSGQQGLMDLAFDPDFATNRQYYVFYTLGTPNRDRVSRFTANASLTGTVAGSELVIYQDPLDANSEHHGGALNFGNDGKLYVTTGEHFGPAAAQSLTSPRGKILRFNRDGTVPADNPFFDGAGPNVDAIWALGLRNPFRAFYDAPTGRLYIGDVGGNDPAIAQEEVHVGVAGANYGWPTCEGFSCGTNPTFTSPIYAYPHNGRDASITGGFIYRGSQFPAAYQGNYFFADYAQNWIKRLTLDPAGNVTGTFNFEPPNGAPDGPFGDIVYLSQGPDGALYYVDLGFSDVTGQTGISKIRRIRFISNDQPPVVVVSAQPTQGASPLTVNFSSAGTRDPEGAPLSYLWTFGDTTTSAEANPVHIYVGTGSFSARLSVSDGVNATLSAPIVISVGSRPVPVVQTPAAGMFFRAGDVVSFSGDATDAEDGTLPASAFSWAVDFLHEGHVHPGLPQTGVKAGTFTIPTSGHDFAGNTRYRITLTVTDSDGLQGSQSVLIFPDKVNLSFDTVPTGVNLSLDGIPHATPFVHETLIGFNHAVDAPNQTAGQNVYTFANWSDGGAQQHTLVVPVSAQSYTATYSVSQNPLPTGLLAGYRFDEGSGTTTADVSGNGITGALVNGPTWTAGRYGGGLTFNGTSYVDLGNPAALQLTGSMTLTAWIRISANPFDDATIVGKMTTAGWQLKTTQDTGQRTAAIQISSTGSNSIQRYGRTVLAVNTWYHVAGVYDAAARTLAVYLDGVLDSGVLSGTVPASQANLPVNVNIAQRTRDPGGFNFRGTIDEVHVFNRALTAAEIQTDRNTPR